MPCPKLAVGRVVGEVGPCHNSEISTSANTHVSRKALELPAAPPKNMTRSVKLLLPHWSMGVLERAGVGRPVPLGNDQVFVDVSNNHVSCRNAPLKPLVRMTPPNRALDMLASARADGTGP